MPKKEATVKNGGYLIRAAQTRAGGMSYQDMAELLAAKSSEGETPASILTRLKNYSNNRTAIPVKFLVNLGKVLDFGDDWHRKIPLVNVIASERDSRHASTIQDVPVLIAPWPRSAPLRSLFVHNPSSWKRKIELPAIFARNLPVQSEGDYQALIADIVEADPCKLIRAGDVFAIRTDMVPEPGRMVLATSKKGEPLRRLLVEGPGGRALRCPGENKPDISILEVFIDGVIIGRVREDPNVTDPQDVPVNYIYRPKGLLAWDLG